MQTSNRVKAQFFALYLGQEVMSDGVFDKLEVNAYSFTNSVLEKNYLLLRSIGSLMDEEVRIIAKITGIDTDSEYSVQYSRREIANFVNDETYHFRFSIIDKIAAYLRSIGVLIDFTYLSETGEPITLSPTQIITAGMAKYR